MLVIALVSFITNVWLAKPGGIGSNDLHHHCDLGLDLWWYPLSFKNCGATKQPATYHVWLSIQRPFMMDRTRNSDRWNRRRRCDQTKCRWYDSSGCGLDWIPVTSLSNNLASQGKVMLLEKVCLRKADSQNLDSLLESESLLMGTNVTRTGDSLGLGRGDETMMGAIEQPSTPMTNQPLFEREMNTISWLFDWLMLVMVPVVFVGSMVSQMVTG